MTGFHRPTMPGSSSVDVVRTRMPAGTEVVACHGVLARTAASTCHHPCRRLIEIAAKPHSHMAKSRGGIQSVPDPAGTAATVSSESSANGALTSRTADAVMTVATAAGACVHSTTLPAAVNVANGTRNLA